MLFFVSIFKWKRNKLSNNILSRTWQEGFITKIGSKAWKKLFLYTISLNTIGEEVLVLMVFHVHAKSSSLRCQSFTIKQTAYCSTFSRYSCNFTVCDRLFSESIAFIPKNSFNLNECLLRKNLTSYFLLTHKSFNWLVAFTYAYLKIYISTYIYI